MESSQIKIRGVDRIHGEPIATSGANSHCYESGKARGAGMRAYSHPPPVIHVPTLLQIRVLGLG